MQEHFTITLPLNLGLEAVKHNPNSFIHKISTIQSQISIAIPSHILVGLTHHLNKQSAHLHVVQKNWSYNIHNIKLDHTLQQKGQVVIATNQQNTQNYTTFPFRIKFSMVKQVFKVNINKLSVEIKLTPVSKPKFVKNQLLQNIIKCHQESWGLITMDQSQRIVIQAQQSKFPAIGLWVTHKDLNSLKTLENLIGYCSLRLSKMCRFVCEGRKFIYLAHLSQSNKTPQLYLVQWINPQQSISQLDFSLSQISKQNQLIIRSDQHSLLQFTLRSDEKVPKKLQNIECSPIVFKEQPQVSLESSAPDSPRFSNPQKGLQVECATLRRLVKIQNQEIIKLKKELRRICTTVEGKQNHFGTAKTRSSPLKAGKLLTQRDLSLGSFSDPSTVSGSDPAEQWSPWQHFQIVQK